MTGRKRKTNSLKLTRAGDHYGHLYACTAVGQLGACQGTVDTLKPDPMRACKNGQNRCQKAGNEYLRVAQNSTHVASGCCTSSHSEPAAACLILFVCCYGKTLEWPEHSLKTGSRLLEEHLEKHLLHRCKLGWQAAVEIIDTSRVCRGRSAESRGSALWNESGAMIEQTATPSGPKRNPQQSEILLFLTTSSRTGQYQPACNGSCIGGTELTEGQHHREGLQAAS